MLIQVPNDRVVLLALKLRIIIQDAGGDFPGRLQNAPILSQVGNAEVENAALLCALDIARAPEAEVRLGDIKTVIGADHGLNALFALLAELKTRHQNTERLLGTTPHAPPQLMEL